MFCHFQTELPNIMTSHVCYDISNFWEKTVCSTACICLQHLKTPKLHIKCKGRDHFVYAPSQWETTLQCNIISHWLSAYTKWSLQRESTNGPVDSPNKAPVMQKAFPCYDIIMLFTSHIWGVREKSEYMLELTLNQAFEPGLSAICHACCCQLLIQ